MRGFLNLITILVLSLGATTAASAQAPVPIFNETKTGVDGFRGWNKATSGLPSTIQEIHTPRDNSLFGSVLWIQGFYSSDMIGSLRQSCVDAGFTDFKVTATHTMKGIKYIDGDGDARTVIATAKRRGKTYTMAAIVLYWSREGSDRASSAHVFAAPSDLYAKQGGWIVPASKFFNLNPQTDIKSVLAEGSASPAIQAKKLASIGDIWGKWFYETYVQLMISNTQALSNFRTSVVCATDPACVVVQGP
ncbi:MAG: hypothetical protein AAGK17_10625 [Pseudomonadota bacterium]